MLPSTAERWSPITSPQVPDGSGAQDLRRSPDPIAVPPSPQPRPAGRTASPSGVTALVLSPGSLRAQGPPPRQRTRHSHRTSALSLGETARRASGSRFSLENSGKARVPARLSYVTSSPRFYRSFEGATPNANPDETVISSRLIRAYRLCTATPRRLPRPEKSDHHDHPPPPRHFATQRSAHTRLRAGARS